MRLCTIHTPLPDLEQLGMDLLLAVRELDRLVAIGCQNLYGPIGHHRLLLSTGIDGAHRAVGIIDLLCSVRAVLLVLVAMATRTATKALQQTMLHAHVTLETP